MRCSIGAGRTAAAAASAAAAAAARSGSGRVDGGCGGTRSVLVVKNVRVPQQVKHVWVVESAIEEPAAKARASACTDAERDCLDGAEAAAAAAE